MSSYRIVQNLCRPPASYNSLPRASPTHGSFSLLYLPPNQLEMPVLAWLAFSSTFLSNLSISWMVALFASFA